MTLFTKIQDHAGAGANQHSPDASSDSISLLRGDLECAFGVLSESFRNIEHEDIAHAHDQAALLVLLRGGEPYSR